MTNLSKQQIAYENCLMPLLTALQWRGNKKTIMEARPHAKKVLTLTDYCDVLDHLQYDFTCLSIKSTDFDERLLPCLLVTKSGDVMVLLAVDNNQIKVHDGVKNQELLLTISEFFDLCENAKVYHFNERKVNAPEAHSRGWFWVTIRKNQALFCSAIFLSFMLNILVLSTPIFVMSVYDKVISASSYTMLTQFSVGIGLALIAIFVIYRIRAKHLSLIGIKCDKAIGNHIVNQLLYLAPYYTEMATAGAQIARIKDFDRVREFFSGPYVTIFFELPFIIIALILVGFLAGYLVLVPLTMLLLYAVLGFFLSMHVQRGIKKSAVAFSNLQEFLLESIENIRVIKYTAAIKSWVKRYRDLSAKSNLIGINISVIDAISVSISEVIMIGAGMLVLAFGALQVMKGTLSIGAMLAVMIVIWRILAPAKSIFNALPRLTQLISSVKQINRLMSLKPETGQILRVKQRRINLKGNVNFERVSFRYPAAYNPSLMGVSFNIKAGSTVAILGPNGSGKSTLLKLILGLYQPQAGAIRVDNADIRQLNSLDLRNSIGYLSQFPELFYGSIAENLRLGNPLATDEELRKVANDVGILEIIDGFSQGFDTQITDQSSQHISTTFKQLLCLARTYLRGTSILLLDEPGNGLDKATDSRLIKHLQSIKGKVTVVLTTHRPSDFNCIDSVILMNQGQVVAQGEPNEVLNNAPVELL